MDDSDQESDVIATYIAELFAMHPHLAIKAGLHEYDGQVGDWSDAAIRRRVHVLQGLMPRLEALAEQPLTLSTTAPDAPPRLDQRGQTRWDARLALLDARAELLRWQVWRPHETNPLVYLGLIDISSYVKRNYAPLAQRMQMLIHHMSAIPDVMLTARRHLQPHLARPMLEQSITIYMSLAHFHATELTAFAQQIRRPDLIMAFHKVNHFVIAAYQDFVAHLRMRLPQATAAAAMGAAMLQALLATTEQIDLTCDELLTLGNGDLARNQERITLIASQMGCDPATALAALGRRHPPPQAILSHTQQLLIELRHFIVSHDLMTIPLDGQCIVQETLPVMRFGAAFIDAPGPFETHANAAYYYLTLPDPTWPLAQQEQWMAKQSIPGLANTTIHEAWPGHYQQFLQLAQAPSMASKLFTCMSFTEGWAHYAEQMMIEEGYGQDDPAFALQQVSMALLRDCRFLVALHMHTGGMTVADATEFIERNAYFPTIRAQQEALRGTRDPTYLNYTLGKLLLLDLRDDLRHAHPQWRTRTLHDTLLGFGAPPIPLLRALLLPADAGV